MKFTHTFLLTITLLLILSLTVAQGLTPTGKNRDPENALELLTALENSSEKIYSMHCDMEFRFLGYRVPASLTIKHPDSFLFTIPRAKLKAVFDGKIFQLYEGSKNRTLKLDLSGYAERFLLQSFLAYFRPTAAGFQVSIKVLQKFYNPELVATNSQSYVLKMTPKLDFFPFSMLKSTMGKHYFKVYLNRKTFLPQNLVNYNSRGLEVSRLVIVSLTLNKRTPSTLFKLTLPATVKRIGIQHFLGEKVRAGISAGLKKVKESSMKGVTDLKNYLFNKFESMSKGSKK